MCAAAAPRLRRFGQTLSRQRQDDQVVALHPSDAHHLAEDDRDIILMRHVEQFPNQDVAAALGLSEAAASMRCLRAVRRLQSLLLSPDQKPPS